MFPTSKFLVFPASRSLWGKLFPPHQSSCFNPFLSRVSQVQHPGKQPWNTEWNSPPLVRALLLPSGLLTFTHSSFIGPKCFEISLSVPSWHMPLKCGCWVEKLSTLPSSSFLFLYHATWQFLWAVGIPWDSFTEIFTVSLLKEIAHTGSCLSSFVVPLCR